MFNRIAGHAVESSGGKKSGTSREGPRRISSCSFVVFVRNGLRHKSSLFIGTALCYQLSHMCSPRYIFNHSISILCTISRSSLIFHSCIMKISQPLVVSMRYVSSALAGHVEKSRKSTQIEEFLKKMSFVVDANRTRVKPATRVHTNHYTTTTST